MVSKAWLWGGQDEIVTCAASRRCSDQHAEGIAETLLNVAAWGHIDSHQSISPVKPNSVIVRATRARRSAFVVTVPGWYALTWMPTLLTSAPWP
jgi:hypothetical protein